MFLRAGGAVTRHRSTPAARPCRAGERWLGIGVALAAVGGTVAFVMPRIIDTLAMLGPASALPLIAASATAAVASTPSGPGRPLRRLTATIVGVPAPLATLGGYLLVLTWWDGVLAGALPEVPVDHRRSAGLAGAGGAWPGSAWWCWPVTSGRQPDDESRCDCSPHPWLPARRRSGAAPVATTPV